MQLKKTLSNSEEKSGNSEQRKNADLGGENE